MVLPAEFAALHDKHDRTSTTGCCAFAEHEEVQMVEPMVGNARFERTGNNNNTTTYDYNLLFPPWQNHIHQAPR